MSNNLEYYPCKTECCFEACFYLILTCVGIWLCFSYGLAPLLEIQSSKVVIIRWIARLFGKSGVIILSAFLTTIIGLVCYININAIIRCSIIIKRHLPSDWEKRKKNVKKEGMTLPNDMTSQMFEQLMKFANLPQQQVSVVVHKNLTPDDIIVFPNIECYKYVPVYFDSDNYYVYKTGQAIVFSVMDNKRLTSYKVDQSDVDFVNKCEKLADDIRKHPDKYQDARIEDFKPLVYDKNLSNNK